METLLILVMALVELTFTRMNIMKVLWHWWPLLMNFWWHSLYCLHHPHTTLHKIFNTTSIQVSKYVATSICSWWDLTFTWAPPTWPLPTNGRLDCLEIWCSMGLYFPISGVQLLRWALYIQHQHILISKRDHGSGKINWHKPHPVHCHNCGRWTSLHTSNGDICGGIPPFLLH